MTDPAASDSLQPVRRGRLRWVLPGIVFMLALGVYANSLHNGFALDDERIIVQNEWVHGWDMLPLAVDSGYWPTGTQAGQLYRPVTTASYTINWSLAGPEPLSFHAVNIALHAAFLAGDEIDAGHVLAATLRELHKIGMWNAERELRS